MSDIIGDMLREDASIREKISKIAPEPDGPSKSQKMRDCLFERHRLYARYENIAKNAGDSMRAFMISTMREDVMLQALMFKMKADIEEDTAKIFSRLDDLETKIQDLTKKQ